MGSFCRLITYPSEKNSILDFVKQALKCSETKILQHSLHIGKYSKFMGGAWFLFLVLKKKKNRIFAANALWWCLENVSLLFYKQVYQKFLILGKNR